MTDAFSEIVLPVFQRVIELVGTLGTGPPPGLDAVKTQVRAWVDGAELKAAQQPGLANEFAFAKFGLVAWIDEVLTESAWGEAVEWGSEEHVLEWDVYRSHVRARLFYEHARAAYEGVDQDRCTSDPIEVYLLCVALGFRGDLKYNEQDLDAWVDKAYTKVAESDTLADRAFSEADTRGHALGARRAPALLLTVCVLVAVTAVCTVMAYTGAVWYAYDSVNP